MSISITIFLVVAGLFLFVLLLGLLIKKDFKLEKQVTIHQPAQTVFNFIKLIRNQEKYSVWVMKDPEINIVYTGIDGTPGFTSTWESANKNVGVGEQEIKQVIEGESVEVEIRFKKPFQATNRAITKVTALSGHETKLSNIFSGSSTFPMNIMNLFMEKLVGKDMQQNLDNVKKILENQGL